MASIISPIWHSADERDAAREVPQVANLLGIKPGMTIADVGAGSGYYAIRLSPIVGDDGRILAEDVVPAYLALLRSAVEQSKLRNITASIGTPDDPKLPPHSVDVVLMVHMYHEIDQPFALLFNLASALRPGAKIGIVDAIRPILQHGTPPDLLKCEVEAMGYRETLFQKLEGSESYLAVFDLPEGKKPTEPAALRPCKEKS